MSTVIEKQRQRVDALPVQQFKRAAEVVMRDIGDKGTKPLVFFGEFGLTFELVAQHAAGPDGCSREQQGIFAPLLYDFHFDFHERTIL